MYSGPGGDNTNEAINKSNDVVKEKKTDVKTEVKSDGMPDESTGMQAARCMVPPYHPYKCPQTARRGHVKMPMTRLNSPRDLGNLKSHDVAIKTEETEEQKYVSNIIIPDAEIETSDTAYDDWLAAQGLLGLQASPASVVDAQHLARQTSLNNLNWSLDVIYKFIKQNEFSVIEKSEVQVKLKQIMDLLKEEPEEANSAIHKIHDENQEENPKIEDNETKKKDTYEKVETTIAGKKQRVVKEGKKESETDGKKRRNENVEKKDEDLEIGKK